MLVATPGQLDDVVWTLGALTLTFAAAIVSWVALEHPILTGRPFVADRSQGAPHPAPSTLDVTTASD